MDTRQNLALASFRRCQKVAARYLADVGADESSARAVLDDVVARMEEIAAEQREALAAARAETKRQEVLASVIRRNHLHPLVVVLHSRGLHDGIPKSARKRLPRRELVMTSMAVAARAEQVKDRLVRVGLPPDFLTEMVRSTRALDRSLQVRDSHLGTAAGSTAGLLMHIRRGRHALNGIEALLSIRYAMEPQVMLEWRHARRMRRGGRPVRDDADSAAEGTGPETGDAA